MDLAELSSLAFLFSSCVSSVTEGFLAVPRDAALDVMSDAAVLVAASTSASATEVSFDSDVSCLDFLMVRVNRFFFFGNTTRFCFFGGSGGGGGGGLGSSMAMVVVASEQSIDERKSIFNMKRRIAGNKIERFI
jgi:hypothetical protein